MTCKCEHWQVCKKCNPKKYKEVMFEEWWNRPQTVKEINVSAKQKALQAFLEGAEFASRASFGDL